MEATRRPWLWCGVHWLSAQALWAPAGGVLACQTADAAGTEATCRSWLWCGVHWLSALVLGHRLGDELAARQLAAAGAEAMCRPWLWCVGLWLLGRTCSPADAEAEAMCSSWLWCHGHWFRGRARPAWWSKGSGQMQILALGCCARALGSGASGTSSWGVRARQPSDAGGGCHVQIPAGAVGTCSGDGRARTSTRRSRDRGHMWILAVVPGAMANGYVGPGS